MPDLHASRLIPPFSLALLLAGLSLLAITHYRSPRFYAGLVTAVILSMLVTPLMQANHVLAFSQRQQAKQAQAEQQQQATQAVRDLQTDISGRNFNPLTNPLANSQDVTTHNSQFAIPLIPNS